MLPILIVLGLFVAVGFDLVEAQSQLIEPPTGIEGFEHHQLVTPEMLEPGVFKYVGQNYILIENYNEGFAIAEATNWNRIIESYDDNGKPVWVDRIITKENGKLKYESERYGSYIADENNCTFEVYESGIIDGAHERQGYFKGIAKSATHGTDVWSDEAINNESCTVAVTETPNGPTFVIEQDNTEVIGVADTERMQLVSFDNGTKNELRPIGQELKITQYTVNEPITVNHPNGTSSVYDNFVGKVEYGYVETTGGVFKTVWDIRDGQVEWTHKMKNNDINKLDKKFGFTTSCEGPLCEDLEVDGVSINEGQAVEKPNLIGKDIKIGKGQLKKLLDLKEETHGYTWAMKKINDKMVIDFTHAKDKLAFGEELVVDPVFSGDAIASGRVYGSAGTHSNCSDSSYSGTNTTFRIKKDNSGDVGGTCNFAYMNFGVSALNGQVLTSGYLEIDVDVDAGSDDGCKLIDLPTQATVGSATVWSEALATDYMSDASTVCNATGNDQQIPLNANGLADIQANLDAQVGYQSIAIGFDDNVRDGSTYGDKDFSDATLVLTWKLPVVPFAPTLDSVSIIAGPGLRSSWTHNPSNFGNATMPPVNNTNVWYSNNTKFLRLDLPMANETETGLGAVTNDFNRIFHFDSLEGAVTETSCLTTCDGTEGGAPTKSVSGVRGDAWSFDGTDDYVVAGTTSDWEWLHDGTTKFSIAFWAKQDGGCSSGEPEIIGTAQASASNVGLAVWCTTSEQLVFYMMGTPDIPIDWTSAISWFETGWHHYVFTYDPTLSSDHLTVYKDGSFVANDSNNNENHNSGASTVPMNFMRSDQTTDKFINGDLDDVVFFKNKILTSGEVTSLYNSGNSMDPNILADPAGIYAFYDFEDTGSTLTNQATIGKDGEIRDYSGNDAHPVITTSDTVVTGIDVSTLSNTSSPCDVSAKETALHGLVFNNDDTKMYISGSTNDDAHEYSLSVTGDVSTCSFVATLDTSPQVTDGHGIDWNENGTRFYMLDASDDVIHQYNCTTPFSFTSCSFASKTLSTNSQDSDMRDVRVIESQNKIFTVGTVNDKIYEYTCTDSNELDTCSYSTASSGFGAQEGVPFTLEVSETGDTIYVGGASGTDVNRFNCSTSYLASSCTYDSVSSALAGSADLPWGFRIGINGDKFYYVEGSDDVKEYDVTAETAYVVPTITFESGVFGNQVSAPDLILSTDTGAMEGTGDWTVGGWITLTNPLEHVLMSHEDNGVPIKWVIHPQYTNMTKGISTISGKSADLEDYFDTDAGWATTSSTYNKVDTANSEIWGDWYRDTNEGHMDWDFGSAVCDTSCVFRFSFEMDSATSSNTHGFFGLSNSPTTEWAGAQDKLTFYVVGNPTESSRTLKTMVSDNQGGNSGDIGTDLTLNPVLDTEYFFEVIRDGSTVYLHHYSDGTYTTITETETDTITGTVDGLQYFKSGGWKIDAVSSSMIVKFDSLILCDGVTSWASCPDAITTFFDHEFNPPIANLVTVPDFDETVFATGWTSNHSDLTLDTANGEIDVIMTGSSDDHEVYYDLTGGGFTCTSQCVLRFQLDVDTIAYNPTAGQAVGLRVGLFETMPNSGESPAIDAFQYLLNTGNTKIDNYVSVRDEGSHGFDNDDNDPIDHLDDGNTFYMELIRDGSNFSHQAYTDLSFSTPTGSAKSHTDSDSIDLRYIGARLYTQTVGGGGYTGSIPFMQYCDGVTSFDDCPKALATVSTGVFADDDGMVEQFTADNFTYGPSNDTLDVDTVETNIDVPDANDASGFDLMYYDTGAEFTYAISRMQIDVNAVNTGTATEDLHIVIGFSGTTGGLNSVGQDMNVLHGKVGKHAGGAAGEQYRWSLCQIDNGNPFDAGMNADTAGVCDEINGQTSISTGTIYVEHILNGDSLTINIDDSPDFGSPEDTLTMSEADVTDRYAYVASMIGGGSPDQDFNLEIEWWNICTGTIVYSDCDVVVPDTSPTFIAVKKSSNVYDVNVNGTDQGLNHTNSTGLGSPDTHYLFGTGSNSGSVVLTEDFNTDVWGATGSKISIDEVTNERLDIDMLTDNSNHAVSYNIGDPITDSFVLTYKTQYTTNYNGNERVHFIGLSDSPHSTAETSAQDFVGMTLGDTNPTTAIMWANGAGLQASIGQRTDLSDLSMSTDYYFTISFDMSTQLATATYCTTNYCHLGGTQVDSQSVTASGIIGLDEIVVKGRVSAHTGSATDGWLDDITFCRGSTTPDNSCENITYSDQATIKMDEYFDDTVALSDAVLDDMYHRSNPIFIAATADSDGSTTTYDHSPLTPGSEYCYFVESNNAVGPSPMSNVVCQDAGAEPPTNLVADAESHSQIDLQWTNSPTPGVNGYKIERESPLGGGWSVIVANTTNTNNYYNNTGLSTTTQYNYRVSALLGLISSDPSNEANDYTLPAPPTSLTASAVSQTQIDLSWTAPATGTVDGYKIERESPIGGGWSVLVADTGNTDTTYSDTGLTTTTQYNYRVFSLNGTDVSLASNEDDATTYGVPSQITDLDVDGVSNSQIDLSWTEPSNNGSPITGYWIEYESPIGGGWLTAVPSHPNTTYNHTSLSSNTVYNYRVSAINSYGTGTASNTDADYTYPDAPTTLLASVFSTTQINLSWVAPSGPLTGYKIERESPVGGGFSVLIANTTNTNVTFNDTGLTNSTQYNYRVYALGNGTSTASNESNATTYTPPGTTTLDTVSSSDPTPLDIVIDWTAPSSGSGSLIGYKIFKESPVGNGWTELINNTASTTTQYTDSGQTTGTQYNYMVAAWSSCQDCLGNNSTAVAYTTPVVPDAPTGTTVLPEVGNTSMNIAWTAPGNDGGSSIKGYKIERNINSAGWTTWVADTGSTATSASNTGLSDGNDYAYRVSAINYVGIGSVSNTDNSEFSVAAINATATSVGGNTVKFDTIVNMTNGIPDTTLTNLQLKLASSGGVIDTWSGSVSLAKLAEYTFPAMYAYPETDTLYYLVLTTNNGVPGQTRVFQTGNILGQPLTGFTGNLYGSERRISNYTNSELLVSSVPTNFDVVVKYQHQDATQDPTYHVFENIEALVNNTRSVDPDSDYYISIYLNPTFTFSGNATVADATIPTGYPSDLTIRSLKSPTAQPQLGIESMGDLFGLPMVFVFIIAVGAIFTPRSAPMGILIIGAMIGAMAYLGYIDFGFDTQNLSTAGTWALIIVAIIVGIFVGKRYD